MFPQYKFLCISYVSYECFVPHTPRLFKLISLMTNEDYKLWSFSCCDSPPSCITSSLLGVNLRHPQSVFFP
jgi:hypothetical protein